ncbi:lipase family protein [Mucilaginibacter paludis]|uniref:Lipase class 3 n=1 Tax=Mucilaginibacter paludis DSM 18603 TaxID=714943 RepID=H1Y8B2_9SPHI|nr:lipase class 3 [Mucilaginibacter paludis]EHQ24931.1 lipase class 3 [Mucilaginibacter paludis DSM 18603]
MNQFQQIFAMSMISNMAKELVNDTSVDSIEQAEQAMQTQLKDAIPGYLTDYGLSGVSVAWGPAVYIAPKDYSSNNNGVTATASNTMVVFNLAINSVNTYVVAIAGTKATSVFDVVVEDGQVVSTVKWAFGSPGGLNPKISTGTNDGVNILLYEMTDPSTGLSISDFFAGDNINVATNSVVVTGHSLGGALAPALALALFGTAATVNPALLQAANVYATAGPDIGNKDYVQYFTQSFKATGPGTNPVWQQFNCKIWNSLDVVPQAWANLGVIKSIYASNGVTTPKYVNCIITRAQVGTALDDYSPMDPDKKGQFAGTFVQPADTPGYNCTAACVTSSDKDDADLCDFVAEMLYQHVAAYSLEILQTTPSIPFDVCSVTQQLYNNNICLCAHL